MEGEAVRNENGPKWEANRLPLVEAKQNGGERVGRQTVCLSRKRRKTKQTRPEANRNEGRIANEFGTYAGNGSKKKMQRRNGGQTENRFRKKEKGKFNWLKFSTKTETGARRNQNGRSQTTVLAGAQN